MIDTIIVGVDDSEGARHALRFAAELASSTAAQLRVVHAYEFGLGWIEAGNPERPLWERRARMTAEDAVARIVGDALDGTASPDVRVVEGEPARVLFDEAADADLLVVGTRGRGGFTSLLLGSVSHHLTQNAPCPVVVVPPQRGSS